MSLFTYSIQMSTYIMNSVVYLFDRFLYKGVFTRYLKPNAECRSFKYGAAAFPCE